MIDSTENYPHKGIEEVFSYLDDIEHLDQLRSYELDSYELTILREAIIATEPEWFFKRELH